MESKQTYQADLDNRCGAIPDNPPQNKLKLKGILIMKEKIKNLFPKQIGLMQALLTLTFTLAIVISNIISARTFNFFGFTMTSAVFLFPITYVLSDVFSEVYGYKWSRITCYLGFGANFLAMAIFSIVSVLPTLPWMEETAGSFNIVLGGLSACTIASLIAFVAGDFVNDKIFAKIKQRHIGLTNQTGFGFRAIVSSVAGEFVDSLIYIPLAFCVFNPVMGFGDAMIMVLLQVGIKVVIELIILPLTQLIVRTVAKKEEKNLSNNV